MTYGLSLYILAEMDRYLDWRYNSGFPIHYTLKRVITRLVIYAGGGALFGWFTWKRDHDEQRSEDDR